MQKKGGETMEDCTSGAGEFLGDDLVEEDALSRYGRRALMLGAGAAGAGLAVAVLGSADPAAAANGGPVELGESNTASASTVITASGGNGLNGITTSPETYSCGVYGEASSGIGVLGTPTTRSGLLGGNLGGEAIPSIAAVVGDSGAGVAILGVANEGTAVAGFAFGYPAIYGVSEDAGGVVGLVVGDVQGQSGVFGDDGTTTGGYGIQGTSTNGTGVYGFQSSTSGLLGESGPASAGVIGDSGDGPGVLGLSSATSAVYGITSGNAQSGVYALDESTDGGYGVTAISMLGTGVFAAGPVALQVDGVAKFSRSGVATVAGTATDPAQTVIVTGVALTASSLILATPQGIVKKVAVEGVVPNVSGGSFEIYLTKAITVSLKVAWFVVG